MGFRLRALTGRSDGPPQEPTRHEEKLAESETHRDTPAKAEEQEEACTLSPKP